MELGQIRIRKHPKSGAVSRMDPHRRSLVEERDESVDHLTFLQDGVILASAYWWSSNYCFSGHPGITLWNAISGDQISQLGIKSTITSLLTLHDGTLASMDETTITL